MEDVLPVGDPKWRVPHSPPAKSIFWMGVWMPQNKVIFSFRCDPKLRGKSLNSIVWNWVRCTETRTISPKRAFSGEKKKGFKPPKIEQFPSKEHFFGGKKGFKYPKTEHFPLQAPQNCSFPPPKTHFFFLAVGSGAPKDPDFPVFHPKKPLPGGGPAW